MRIYLNDYNAATLEKAESILFNGNGFIGVRGNLEEAYYTHFATNRETYINGFYETRKIEYAEKFHGFAEMAQTMISVPDGQTTFINIGGEPFRVDLGRVDDSQRWLDMEAGCTFRELVWTSPAGRKTRIGITRLASFAYKNIFAVRYEFEKLNHDEEITLETHVNFCPVKTIDPNDPRMSHAIQQVEVVECGDDFVSFKAHESGLSAEVCWRMQGRVSGDRRRVTICHTLDGDTYTKIFSYAFDDVSHMGLDISFDKLKEMQRDYLSDFWHTARVEIDSDLDIESSVNFGTYTLLSSLGTGGHRSIAAKGLSGSGYEGHVFWDTEMYMFPVFLFFAPKLAKEILQFRINTLPAAKENRKAFGYDRGVLFPWRTISGRECSPFFEAGAAQHHINADIAYAVISYYRCTGDVDLLKNGGYEILLEAARFFAEVGHEAGGEFHIDMVTGPDEYTALVCDNYYTNVMVKFLFTWVNKVAERLGVSDDETASYVRLASIMAKPVDNERRLVAQDRDFLQKAQWPYWGDTERHPLLLHFHPLTIYRYQVCKQADAVLALMLLPDEEDLQTTENTVRYYDGVTTHDSSLSFSAFSIMFTRIGDVDKGYDYFLKNARLDLDNLHKNTKDGLHLAGMGGTILTLLYGFCGLRITDEGFTLNPCLPKQIRSIKLAINNRGKRHEILVGTGGKA
ncbi:MAG: family 65 glycosyl hydrolase [Defluviitaleaceae bacterium]|nr:family 65 glycosyl hydrolase [Defluviitaleaceae bacterium]